MTTGRGSAEDRSLGELQAAVLRWSLRRVAVAGVLWVVTGVLALLAAAWLLSGEEGWGAPSPGPLLLLAGLVLGGLALLSHLLRWTRTHLDRRGLSRAMEEGARLPAGAVQGALELQEELPVGTSPMLVRAASDRILAALGRTPAELSGPLEKRTGDLRPPLVAILLLAGITSLFAWMGTDRALGAWGGLLSPLSALASPALPPLTMHPLDAAVVRGEGLPVSVRAPLRDRVTVIWQAQGELPDSAVVGVGAESEAYLSLPPVNAATVFWAVAPDGAEGPRGEVRPVDPLLLAGWNLDLRFPPHTGRAPERMREPSGPLELPVGTRIGLSGQASRSLVRAELADAYGEGAPLELAVSGRDFSGEWVPRDDGLYRLDLADEAGMEVAPPPQIEVRLVPDRPPSLSLLEPAEDGQLPSDLRATFLLEASDDYGLGELRMEIRRGGEEEAGVRRFPLGGVREVRARPVLDLSGWGLRAGEEVRIRVVALDNAPEPQASVPAEVALRVPGREDLLSEARAGVDALTGELAELASRAERAADETRDLSRSSGRDGGDPRLSSGGGGSDPDFQDREALRRAGEEQGALLAETEAVQERLQALQDLLQESGALDAELMRDLQDLRSLLSQADPSRARDRLELFQEQLQERDLQRALEGLEQMARDGEALRDRLAEALDRARRAGAEEELRGAIRDTDDLAREERELAAALDSGDDPASAAERQEALLAEASALEERLDRLSERLGQLEEDDASERARDAGRSMASVTESMESAAREARADRSTRASEEASRAADALDGLSEELQAAQKELLEQWLDQLLDALDGAAVEALGLALDQERLREGLRDSRASVRAGLRTDQAALLQGIRNTTQRLADASRTSPGAVREVTVELGRAMESAVAAVEALGERSGFGDSPLLSTERAHQALNDAARAAMEARERLEEAGAQGASALDDLLQELEELAGQQGDLLSEAESLLAMEMGSGSQSDQLSALAQGQEAVAGELGDLADHPGSSDLPLGDLDSLAEEAQALARELEGGRLDPEVVQRQERLFQRLLEAGRTLRQEEPSTEREGTTATTVEAPAVSPLDPALLRGFAFPPPTAEELEGLPPAQRNLILRYFERLNRQSQPEGNR